MRLTIERDKTTISDTIADFGITDTAGRAVGAYVWVFKIILGFPEAGQEPWFYREPGTYYTVQGHQTRDGYAFGPGSETKWFDTEDEAREHAARYLKSARARAKKLSQPPRATFSRINRAIRHLGLQVRGNGDGYFYFVDRKTNHQIGSNVDRPKLHHASVETWVRDAEHARKSEIIEGFANE